VRVEGEVIRQTVAAGWGLRIRELRYFPEGGGAYHWMAFGDDGDKWFVTCDDLDTKPWLGTDRDSVFNRLLAAYGTAIELRAGGSEFVVAPTPTAEGVAAVRIDERHSVSVLEFVDGKPGRWGESPGAVDEVVAMLARLHRADPTGYSLGGQGLVVPGRDGLEAALDNLGSRWDGGPLSESARGEIARQADVVVGSLADLDRFAVRVDSQDADAVVTHGEPHPGNLMRTAPGLRLIDWDTVALDRPERDLWMLAGTGPEPIATYRRLTGIALDPDALRAYRLLWALRDVAAFTAQLRGEHRQDANAEWALAGLGSILAGREPSPYAPALAGRG